MTDDLESSFFTLVGFSTRGQESADSEMRGRTLLLRHEQICRLLHTVVHKPIRVRRTENQLEAKRFPQIRIESFLRRSLDGGQRGRLRTISEAGQSLQCFLGNER